MQSLIYSDDVINEVKKYLSVESFKYIYSPKFIFLCGKGYDYSDPKSYSLTNRGVIQSYISVRDSSTNIVLSEKLWENELLKEIDLLTFEEFLAEMSDYVLLFVESMGSACELGAFTFSNESLMKKLVVIVSDEYKTRDSFIKNGPIEKALRFGVPVLYADLSGPLLSNRELVGLVDKLVSSLKERSASNKRVISRAEEVTLASFVPEALELIRLFQPIKSDDLLHLYKTIKDFSSFTLVKKDGSQFSTKVKTSLIFQLLLNLEIVSLDENGFSLSKKTTYENFMFSFTPLTLSRTRSKILSRKYKYKEI